MPRATLDRRHDSLRRLRLAALITLAVAPRAAPSHAQIPDQFTNLKVFPKEIPKRELVEAMKGFTRALGVRCEHCHATKPGADPRSGELEDLDFASDAREAKQRAREMLAMVRAINADHLAKLTGGSTITVRCVTCHRGVTEPETIEDRIQRLVEDEGIEAAVADYRQLRSEYLTSGTYDFDEGPVRLAAERLLASGKAEEAIALLRLETELHPDSARGHLVLGEALLATGERDAAKAAFEKSLELEPDNPPAKKRLAELAAPAPEPPKP